MSENRLKLSISMDGELVRRIDAVADARGESRSAAMERILNSYIRDEEEFIADMENPVLRAVHAALTSSPVVVRAMVKLAGESLSQEEVESILQRAPKHREGGRKRQQAKKAGTIGKEATT